MINSDQWCNGLAVGRQVTQGSARDRARRHLGSCPPDFHVTKVKINAREDKKQRESQAANFKGVFLFYLLNFNQPANWGRCARLMWGAGGRSECSGGSPIPRYTSRLLCAKVYEEDYVDFYTPDVCIVWIFEQMSKYWTENKIHPASTPHFLFS